MCGNRSAGWGAQTESRLEVMAGIRWTKVGRRRPGEPHSTAFPGAGALGRHGSAPPQKARIVIVNGLLVEITSRGRGERGEGGRSIVFS